MQDPVQYARTTRARRCGIGIAVATALLVVWTTIVHDDGNGAGALMLVLAAGMAWFATRGQAGAMARAMLGIAGMQLALGGLIATAPVTAKTPGATAQAIIGALVFAAAWLLAAACFQRAARIDSPIPVDPLRRRDLPQLIVEAPARNARMRRHNPMPLAR